MEGKRSGTLGLCADVRKQWVEQVCRPERIFLVDLSFTMSILYIWCDISPYFQFVQDQFGSPVTGTGEEVGE